MAKKRDEYLEGWEEVQASMDPGETAEDRILGNILCLDWGWWRHRSPSPSNIEGEYCWTYMPHVPSLPSGSPEARAAEDAWEARSIAMHDAQVPVVLPTKPVERSQMRSGTAIAEFDVEHGHAENPEHQRKLKIPLFHESHPASTEVQRKFTRGD